MLKKIVSKNVKSLRIKAGLSQVDLAKKTKPALSVRYISRLENQSPNVTLDVLETLAAALGCGPEDLVQQSTTKAVPKRAVDDIKKAIQLLKSVKESMDE
ncbi:MAG: helix-turn-helix transcriptional regulator [Bdellovibrionaceae bacterium]|nr:helix-turn-helix transcriptional regulator [Pseudobdellovibrionaceae bacterium]